ncbi:MAG TPA: FtsX-like permease family protein [Bacteroidales bacterium]|nr:FtsX-like permease family protein [Bacteroidales bacterium]
MLALKLAFKNLMGAGLRTWLNVSVLSFAFVLIIFYNGMIDGWNRQSRIDTQAWETGEGQFWHPEYDRYDAYTIRDSHSLMSEEIQSEIVKKNLVPVLIAQATAFPQGRMQGVTLRGIDPDQTVLELPTATLAASDDNYYAIIGKRMAESAKIGVGDKLLIRWRDNNGTFDALEIEIASVFKSDVPTVDRGQIYLRLEVLQKMMGMGNEATLLVAGKNFLYKDLNNWEFKDQSFLLADMDKIIQAKKAGGSIMQGLLLIIALIAIFDTQVLSIFRRQKEIGTYIALGMTRSQVVGIFTIEGGAHSILAVLVGAVYGIPLLLWLNKVGISMGYAEDMQIDIPLAEAIYPYYSLQLIIITIILVVISATIVSYLPARKISTMKPTDALKGKLQ